MEATQVKKISDRDKANECLKIFEEAIKAANTIGPGGKPVGEIEPGCIQIEVSFEELDLRCEIYLDPLIPIIKLVRDDLSAKGFVLARLLQHDVAARSILIRQINKDVGRYAGLRK